jgi:hypothetical protein
MTGWSTDGAKAFLLISVAAVDGSFADEEIESLAPSLRLGGLDDAAADTAMGEALLHYRRSLESDGLEGALLACALQLKTELSRPDLESFMARLEDTALADAHVKTNEHAYLRMIRRIWEL